jgi:hypothetical protein
VFAAAHRLLAAAGAMGDIHAHAHTSTHTHARARVCASLQAGESPLQLGPPKEVSSPTPQNPIVFLLRMLLGVAAGFYYFVLPVYMYLKVGAIGGTAITVSCIKA